MVGLFSLCEENNLNIGGSLFAHKTHKLAWTSPDGRTQRQIDHIIINIKWRHSLQHVQVKRGADVGSNHHLLVAKLKLKLRTTKIGQNRNQRLDMVNSERPSNQKLY